MYIPGPKDLTIRRRRTEKTKKRIRHLQAKSRIRKPQTPLIRIAKTRAGMPVIWLKAEGESAESLAEAMCRHIDERFGRDALSPDQRK